ncbi:dienelactone hydrolase family protein [Vibrio splendidus]|jgi:carboxymethylenebutenolidase|uniref:Dienelactone hydrolase family protein n=2 Tax=Vibrio TaxID=662 RepID=A0AA43JYI2_VIBSP|nr:MULTISPECIES: dienelactone hydrolase family protein [Vibrio]CAH7065167.1 Carboxymethylenebutenolidase 2 [Vibrio chagasii]MDH5923144.1 dienelactone hydrolase family protein [Vibrio splendidus]MDH5951624.1 dienelactone hydrolase family protein [Vibrio crassostreae]ROO49602.1 carboxymethylenebutenolidase [Vibrio crassostreae]TCN04682.1 carboxymethylenebutenolidase [Vibrio crassostreae]
MCHGQANKYFPEEDVRGEFNNGLEGLLFGDENTQKRIAILPDIYGVSPFYKGFSTFVASKGARVFLVNTFADFGELPEVTREAAFARRDKVADKAFVDKFEAFCEEQSIDGVIGFCLGGYYIFELARRNVSQDLVGFYGFPQGMKNFDPLPVPFDYLETVSKHHVSLMPANDHVVGHENIQKLANVSKRNAAVDVRIYQDSAHSFLADLDGNDVSLKQNAEDSLSVCLQALGLSVNCFVKNL